MEYFRHSPLPVPIAPSSLSAEDTGTGRVLRAPCGRSGELGVLGEAWEIAGLEGVRSALEGDDWRTVP